MELKEFIGKPMLKTHTKERCFLHQITSPNIVVVMEKPGSTGYPQYYSYRSTNSDPVSQGYLEFEDPSLKEPFIRAYDAYCRSEEGRWEAYDYWLHASY